MGSDLTACSMVDVSSVAPLCVRCILLVFKIRDTELHRSLSIWQVGIPNRGQHRVLALKMIDIHVEGGGVSGQGLKITPFHEKRGTQPRCT